MSRRRPSPRDRHRSRRRRSRPRGRRDRPAEGGADRGPRRAPSRIASRGPSRRPCASRTPSITFVAVSPGARPRRFLSSRTMISSNEPAAISASTARSPRARSTRSSSARTRTCAAGARRDRHERDRGRPRGQGGRDGPRDPRREGLDEMTAVRAALRRAIPGDLVVCCVDDAIGVYREAMAAAGTSRGGTAFHDPGELKRPRAEAPRSRPRPMPRRGRPWSRGTSSVSSDATSTGRAPGAEQLEDAVAVLVAHEHDDPRRVRAPAVGPAPAAPLSSAWSAIGLRVVDRHVGRGDPPPARPRPAARRRPIPAVRPRRYLSVCLMATRCARSAAIRPIPRSVSSGRSPAVPMIAVIGAARPAAPAGDPLGDVEDGARPRPRCGRSRR